MSKSIAMFIEEMKAITTQVESNILNKIGVVDAKVEAVNTRIDNMAEYMSETNKSIIQRIAKLEQHVLQPSQKCEPPKTVNTVQYNSAAQRVKPIGTCKVMNRDTKAWETVDFFGFCKNCGDPILSPSVVGYCEVNKVDLKCYPCQKGKTRSAKYMDITLFNGTKAPTPVQQQDTSVVLKCDICGQPRKYKSSEDYLAKKKYAESLGLKGTMCTCCAKKALATLSQKDQELKYEDPIAHERERREDKRIARANEVVEKPVEPMAIEDAVMFLLSHGQSEDSIRNMKIAEVREFCDKHSIVLGFDGRQWNTKKGAVVDAIESAIVNKGKEIDAMMHPVNPHQVSQEVVDVDFKEIIEIIDSCIEPQEEPINQGF